MSIEIYSTVRLREAYHEFQKATLGVVVEVLGDNDVLVEFVDSDDFSLGVDGVPVALLEVTEPPD